MEQSKVVPSKINLIEWPFTDREAILKAGQELGINPLAIEDCLHINQRGKLDDYETHQLMVWFAYIDGTIYEMEFVIFPRTILMVYSAPPPSGPSWYNYLNLNGGLYHQKDSYHLLYHIMDKLTDISASHVQPLFTKIDEFEKELFESKADPRRLLVYKRQLAYADNALGCLSSIVGQFLKFLGPKDDLRWKLRDLLDHCERVHQKLVFHGSQISVAMEMYWGITTKRTNEQIKKLSSLASIALPLSFWTSFWGMNFQNLPYNNFKMFILALSVMGISTIIVYFILKKEGLWERN